MPVEPNFYDHEPKMREVELKARKRREKMLSLPREYREELRELEREARSFDRMGAERMMAEAANLSRSTGSAKPLLAAQERVRKLEGLERQLEARDLLRVPGVKKQIREIAVKFRQKERLMLKLALKEERQLSKKERILKTFKERKLGKGGLK